MAREDLDPIEIVRARNVLKGRDPDSDLLDLDDTSFLTALGALRDGAVTHAGLLLFGDEAILHARCPQHQVHYAHQVSEMELARNDFLRCGLLQVLLRHTTRELTILSPGGFLADITPRNILRHDPMNRNPTLAETFQKLRLVEKSGVGRRRIFMPMLAYGKPVPVYETDSEGRRVILRLRNGSGDPRMAAWVGRRTELGQKFSLEALLVLSRVRSDGSVDVDRAAELLQLPSSDAETVLLELTDSETGFLERPSAEGSPVFEIADRVAQELDDMMDVPDRDEKVLERLFEAFSREPTLPNARRLRDHLEQKNSLTQEEVRKLASILASEAGRQLERAAPLVFAGLNGIVQVSSGGTP